MSGVRIERIKIMGFRAFGEEQIFPLSAPIIAVWAPNSQGKTSLAEAFEFLLTGGISRRELAEGLMDEFADALKNAHIPDSKFPYIEANITTLDGSSHTVRRTLISDYGKRRDCESKLEIDGESATEEAFENLGITLSQPPLRAPVLTQNALNYVFYAKPQDRAIYLKALLEMTNLDNFRETIMQSERVFKSEYNNPYITKLKNIIELMEVGNILAPLLTPSFSQINVTSIFKQAISTIITDSGEEAQGSFERRIATISELLALRRTKTFPCNYFNKRDLVDWVSPDQNCWDVLSAYNIEYAKINEEAQRLSALFQEALNIPFIDNARESIDCPLCNTEDALTLDRINFIRGRIQETGEYQIAKRSASDALTRLHESVRNFKNIIYSACPYFMSKTREQRRIDGFIISRMLELLDDDASELISPWLCALRLLIRHSNKTHKIIDTIIEQTELCSSDMNRAINSTSLKTSFRNLEASFASFKKILLSYVRIEQNLVERLNEVIDASSNISGWSELIELGNDLPNLQSALLDYRAHLVVLEELRQALREIKSGNQMVFGEKFQELSGKIEHWWNLLRPNELTFFNNVNLRQGATRTIDFKAGLSLKEDRVSPEIRNAVSIFSQSQLHCLGLALFIARSVNEGAGFIVLDDPIISSDEDYSKHFQFSVLEELIERDVQIIILTQNHKIWKDLELLYSSHGISMFQMYLDDPMKGVNAENTGDNLNTMLTRATSATRSHHVEQRRLSSEILRNVVERFCKELIIKCKRDSGDDTASLSDYEGKSFRDLKNIVAPFLTEPSHIGKLNAIIREMNPANHDGTPPPLTTLKVSLGNLCHLRDFYFSEAS